MSAIQNHKALWRKKRQCCDAKDVKGKPKTASHVKIAESKCRAKRYAENIKTKTTKGHNLRQQAEASSERQFTNHCKRRMQKN